MFSCILAHPQRKRNEKLTLSNSLCYNTTNLEQRRIDMKADKQYIINLRREFHQIPEEL